MYLWDYTYHTRNTGVVGVSKSLTHPALLTFVNYFMLCLLQLNNVAKVKLKLGSLINSFLIAYTLGLISYDLLVGG